MYIMGKVKKKPLVKNNWPDLMTVGKQRYSSICPSAINGVGVMLLLSLGLCGVQSHTLCTDSVKNPVTLQAFC